MKQITVQTYTLQQVNKDIRVTQRKLDIIENTGMMNYGEHHQLSHMGQELRTCREEIINKTKNRMRNKMRKATQRTQRNK